MAKAYILTDADFRELMLSLHRDATRGRGVTKEQEQALDDAYRFYNYHICGWVSKQGANPAELSQ